MSKDPPSEGKSKGKASSAAKPGPKKKAKTRKKQPKGLAVFTEAGNVPRWISAARFVLVLALAASVPFVIGVEPGRRLFWAAAIASLPLFWVIGGYHLWRRLCPLAVIAQLGRLFGKPGSRRVNAKSWLANNYLILQMAIMLVALSLRLIMTNGTPLALAGFLVAAVVIAIATGLLYTGKTWCNYICPVGMVEKFYTEPARLTGLPNSQCSPCTACKKNCPDIDLEQGYWKEFMLPARRLSYYAWPGIVLAFYTYFYFVAGDWDYYFSGAWTLEDTQMATWLDPGFFFLGAIPIVAAAPLTLIAFGAVSVALFRVLEAAALSATDKSDVDVERIRHRTLATAGFVAFILFYYFGGQPTIRMLPGWFGALFSTAVVVAATAIFVRRWRRSESDFVQEKFAEKILKKWKWGDAPESDSLHDIYLLHHERKKEADARLGAYKETVREMVADGLLTRNELALLDALRAQLGVSDKDHQRVIDELGDEEKQLFDEDYQGSIEQRLQSDQYRRE
ncbi:MAG: 4Fe-4S binding protein, partial [Deltaproteobacteria bacterium]|nr:4Fe-4S binding protein [Deltaproteobacteria bacterium]